MIYDPWEKFLVKQNVIIEIKFVRYLSLVPNAGGGCQALAEIFTENVILYGYWCACKKIYKSASAKTSIVGKSPLKLGFSTPSL